MHKSKLSKAMEMLSVERAALRSGQLEQVVDMTAQKAELIRDLTALRLSASDARKLQESARLNAKLLQAALMGMRAAQERLAALKAVRSGLNIYDSSGSKHTVAKTGSGLEHKV